MLQLIFPILILLLTTVVIQLVVLTRHQGIPVEWESLETGEKRYLKGQKLFSETTLLSSRTTTKVSIRRLHTSSFYYSYCFKLRLRSAKNIRKARKEKNTSMILNNFDSHACRPSVTFIRQNNSILYLERAEYRKKIFKCFCRVAKFVPVFVPLSIHSSKHLIRRKWPATLFA